MKIKKIAIIGGGTAGWLAANHLGLELSADPDFEITLIESEDIGSIGVGEGTVPFIKQSLKKFGISEAELIVSCDVSFKQGIKFINWLNPETTGKDNYYYHPFASPYPEGIDLTEYMLQTKRPFSEVTELVAVAEANRSPKKISSPPYTGAVDYAYHFNAAKFAKLLAKNALARFGIKHRVGTLVDAKLNDEGEIASLIYSDGVAEEYDFYIDCSGFYSLLIDKKMRVPFVSQSPRILSSSALVQQIPLKEDDEIFPYTKATAHSAGWIWDIPLTTRRGVGFVYSDSHLSESEAVQQLSHYLGVTEDKIAPRKISMEIGYREKFWKKNCVALGLAQGFVEPLEATSILVTDFSAGLLARNFPRYRADILKLSAHCNEAVRYTWERVIDFVQMHYLLSNRNDSDFWRDNINNKNISESLLEKLEKWKIQTPQKSDFFSRFDLFDVDNYLYVIYGMRYQTRTSPITEYRREVYESALSHVKQRSALLVNELLDHRDWLDKLKAAAAQQKR